jgi:hypothetical protein
MKNTLIQYSFQEWIEIYLPDTSKYGAYQEGHKPYLYSDEDKDYLSMHRDQHVWSLCTERNEWFIVNGARRTDCLGYYCTLNGWEDNTDYNVSL